MVEHVFNPIHHLGCRSKRISKFEVSLIYPASSGQPELIRDLVTDYQLLS